MKNSIITFFMVLFIAVVWSACTPAHGDYPGNEYMPDMAHSIAYEANHHVYYSFNTWSEKEDGESILWKNYANPRLPVKGTIPRGYTGLSLAVDDASHQTQMAYLEGMPVNGHVPYYYEDTEDERTRASAEILENPFPITEKGLRQGKALYTIYCETCHGEDLDGNGYLVREDGGKYPAQPANLLEDKFIEATEGQYYHAMIYGKNMMGGYADKLSYEERWQVIHYVRSVQAKEKGLAYEPVKEEVSAELAHDNEGLEENHAEGEHEEEGESHTDDHDDHDH